MIPSVNVLRIDVFVGGILCGIVYRTKGSQCQFSSIYIQVIIMIVRLSIFGMGTV
jgi:hypothetical protein